MSLFTKLFPRQSVEIATDGFLNMITGYAPRFTSFDGGVYEAALCRSAIHSFALQCSKLDIKAAGPKQYRLLKKPNQFQTQSQFIYQLATILECNSTAFIFPEYDEYGRDILAIYALAPTEAQVLKAKNGGYWLKARFPQGHTGYVELARVGVLTKHQYKNVFFGEADNPLLPTLKVIDTQNQGIIEGVKSSAYIRFLAKLAQTLKPSDLEAERKRFVESNLNTRNNGGAIVVDAKYSDVKQIESHPFVVDDKQMEMINESVHTYFGTNKKILMNSFTEDEWNAFYEGKIEPFAIQLSQVLTAMLYTEREQGFGNEIICSANRLQYASNKTKLDIVVQLMDRGMLTPNEGREVFNMPGFGEDGDKRYIRLEYTEADKLGDVQGNEEGGNNDAD